MWRRGEGTFLERGPLPHTPSSLPPKTFDLIESLFPAFPEMGKLFLKWIQNIQDIRRTPVEPQ
jgi:hypothetical protein